MPWLLEAMACSVQYRHWQSDRACMQPSTSETNKKDKQIFTLKATPWLIGVVSVEESIKGIPWIHDYDVMLTVDSN